MEVKPGYKQTEVGVIPTDWDAVPIEELFSFKNGLNKAKKFFGYGTPIVNYMDVYGRPALRIEQVAGRVDVSPKELRAYSVRKGDVFFTRTSETVEEIGVASVMLDDAKSTVYSGFVLRARPTNDSLFDSFKAYCFSPRYFRQQITARASYTTRALTTCRSLSAALLARPPLPEQRAIATALIDVDALLHGLERFIAKKRDLKQAAMQQLLTGQTRLPGFSGEWEVKRLGDVAMLKNGYAFKSDTYTSLGTFKVATIANVQDGYMTADACNTIASEPADLQPHQRLKLGDILISMTGNVGRVCRVNEDHCLLNQRVGKLVPVGVVEGLLFVLLGQPSFISAMTGVAKGGAQPNLAASDITEHTFNIPKDAAEQTAIASVLTEMDGELTVLERRRVKTRDLKQAMMQELLTGRTRLVSPEVAHA